MTAVGLSPTPLFTFALVTGPLRDHGVVNVTPDSLSDGGLCYHRADTVAQGSLLAADGADIVDFGGESRPCGCCPLYASSPQRE
jgi:dihydropteroate synthase